MAGLLGDQTDTVCKPHEHILLHYIHTDGANAKWEKKPVPWSSPGLGGHLLTGYISVRNVPVMPKIQPCSRKKKGYRAGQEVSARVAGAVGSDGVGGVSGVA